MATAPTIGVSEKAHTVYSHVTKACLPDLLPMYPSEEDVIECGVIGPTAITDMPPCPCCNRPVENGAESRQTLDEPTCSRRRDIPCAFDFDEEHDEDEDGECEQEDDYLPGVLDSGVEYRFKRVLAEGWVYKKGTGKDWLGSRAWKQRWARLVLAKIEGFSVDVPILAFYWFPSAASPSTVILLDSTVVIPVDKYKNQMCHLYCFDVIHVNKKGNESSEVTRTFSVPLKGRDQWVYAMNSALLKYEKDSAQARREAAALADLRPTSPAFGSIMDGERFRTLSDSTSARPLSPPLHSPRSPLSPKRPLPRPDRLRGESLLN